MVHIHPATAETIGVEKRRIKKEDRRNHRAMI